MKIPQIIFSFEIKNGNIVSVKEHETLDDAESYVKFDIRRTEPNETCFYHIMPVHGSNLYDDAVWVVNFKTKTPETIGNNKKEKWLIDSAIRMISRERKISKLLNYENI